MTIKFYKVRELYGEFSNFSKHAFFLDTYEWKTVEHYFQAQKYINTPRFIQICIASSPRIAADLGRDKTLPLRSDWEQVKVDIMRKAVLKKFITHDNIKKLLLGTGDEEIIENSPTDFYWGIGSGNGQNMLGKILMETRKILIFQNARECELK